MPALFPKKEIGKVTFGYPLVDSLGTLAKTLLNIFTAGQYPIYGLICIEISALDPYLVSLAPNLFIYYRGIIVVIIGAATGSIGGQILLQSTLLGLLLLGICLPLLISFFPQGGKVAVIGVDCVAWNVEWLTVVGHSMGKVTDVMKIPKEGAGNPILERRPISNLRKLCLGSIGHYQADVER